MKLTFTSNGLQFVTMLTRVLRDVARTVKFNGNATGVTITAAGAEFVMTVKIPEGFLSEYKIEEEHCGFVMESTLLCDLVGFAEGKELSVSVDEKQVLIGIGIGIGDLDDPQGKGSTCALKRQHIIANSPLADKTWDVSVQMQSSDLHMIANHCSLISDTVEIKMALNNVTFRSFGDGTNVTVDRHQQDMNIEREDKMPIVHRFNSKLLACFTSLGSIVDQVQVHTDKKAKYPLKVVYNMAEDCKLQVIMKNQSCLEKTLKIMVKGFRIIGRLAWNNKEYIVECLAICCNG